MNREQLKTILWLRWRLMINSWHKAGAVNAVLMIVLTVFIDFIMQISGFALHERGGHIHWILLKQGFEYLFFQLFFHQTVTLSFQSLLHLSAQIFFLA